MWINTLTHWITYPKSVYRFLELCCPQETHQEMANTGDLFYMGIATQGHQPKFLELGTSPVVQVGCGQANAELPGLVEQV